MSFVFEPPPQPSVAIAGDARRFPVRRVFCVGRNYAAHAREMGQTDREPPFFFTKPADAVVDAGEAAGARIPYPPLTSNLHHEIELAVAIAKGGVDIAAERALDHVFGYAAALDLTRRDLQFAAKDKGQPWDWGKAFDRAAPIAPIHPASAVGHPSKGRIWLDVDGQRRQDGDLAEMIWAVPEIVAAVSRSVELRPGDLILTGTPAGVGPITRGQTVRGGIEGLGDVLITVA
jgi:fumarylpyruvate hydrolase